MADKDAAQVADTLTKHRRFQLRCVLEKPISVTAGESITGELRLKAHERQSYDIFLTLIGPPLAPGHPPQRVGNYASTSLDFCSRQLTLEELSRPLCIGKSKRLQVECLSAVSWLRRHPGGLL